MKDFSIKEAADEAALNFPGIPKDVVRHICESAMANIVDIMVNKKGRIRMQTACINGIYFEVVPEKQRAIAADLDESRELTQEEEDLFIFERDNAKPKVPGTVKRLSRRYKRIHYPGPLTGAVYPK